MRTYSERFLSLLLPPGPLLLSKAAILASFFSILSWGTLEGKFLSITKNVLASVVYLWL